MASHWAGLDTEIYGVKRAAQNLKDSQGLAEYIYERISAYMGPQHEIVGTALIRAGLEADPDA